MRLKEFVPRPLRPAAKRAYDSLRVQYDRHVHERPSASYRRRVSKRATLPGFLEYAEKLCADGGVVIPGFFGEDRLTEMREEFERLVATNPPNPDSAKDHSVHIATARFRETALFSELTFEPNMLALVQYYWGKPVVLHGTGGTRYEPARLDDRGSNQWHHDGKRKQVRAFIFLTDVPADGQGTQFVPGSHRIFHHDITRSRASEAEVLAYGTPVSCAGPAGSIAMIDTNAFHRATRNLGPRRDTWAYSYRAPNPMSTQLNPVPVLHPDVVERLTEEQRWIARIA
ncbi:MAG: phytanoyl-CoA dioxygenase family protein [Kiloniellales bacterium]